MAPLDPHGDIGRDGASRFLRKDAMDLDVAHARKTQRKYFRRYLDANRAVGPGFDLRMQHMESTTTPSQSKIISMITLGKEGRDR